MILRLGVGFGRIFRGVNPVLRFVISSSPARGLLGISILLLMFDIFSGGDGYRRGGIVSIFAEAGGGGGGGGANGWISSPSNVAVAVAVTAMAGIALAATVVYSRRGSRKSPWSRRRRKHALLPKQWRSYFDKDGRLSDGGVKFLKKIQSGGVDPSIRAEVWPFLLGIYDLKSTEKERDAIKAQRRREYLNLRRQCRQLVTCDNNSFKLKETFVDDNNEGSSELGRVIDSSGLVEVYSVQDSLSAELVNPESEDDKRATGGSSIQTTNLSARLDGDKSEEAEENISEPEPESSDSDSSEDQEGTQPLLAQDKTDYSSSVEVADFVPRTSDFVPRTSDFVLQPHASENFATWQRIIRLDAVRANSEWVVYSPSQAAVSEDEARQLAESVGLKDFDNLEPCRIFHAARLVAVLEAYAIYDSEVGYCQGMSDLLSPIISVMEEDYEAFWCFVGFMHKARHNFRLDEVGIRRQLGIVSKIIKCKDSQLYRHLVKLQAEDCFFVYRMVVVLLRRELEFEQTLCLWEVMWADQAAIRAGIAKSAWGRMRLKAPPSEDLLLYAIAACVLQRKKLIIEKYSSMDEIMRECNSMAGQLDVWKLLDDAHELVVNLHDRI